MNDEDRETIINALRNSSTLIRRLMPPIICPVAVDAARQQQENESALALLGASMFGVPAKTVDYDDNGLPLAAPPARLDKIATGP